MTVGNEYQSTTVRNAYWEKGKTSKAQLRNQPHLIQLITIGISSVNALAP